MCLAFNDACFLVVCVGLLSVPSMIYAITEELTSTDHFKRDICIMIEGYEQCFSKWPPPYYSPPPPDENRLWIVAAPGIAALAALLAWLLWQRRSGSKRA